MSMIRRARRAVLKAALIRPPRDDPRYEGMLLACSMREELTMQEIYGYGAPRSPDPATPDEFSLPRHPGLKLLFWASTALFLGFSLGILTARLAATNHPTCIDSKSEAIVSCPSQP